MHWALGRHGNIASDHRILDRRRGPIKKTAAVRLLPSLQTNKNTESLSGGDKAGTTHTENTRQLDGEARQAEQNGERNDSKDGGRHK